MAHELLDGVAETTTHRDRDDLDRALARLLLQFLDTRSVTLLRLVEEDQVQRIVRQVSMSRQCVETDSLSTDEAAKLPALTGFAAGHECVTRNTIIQAKGTDGCPLTVFPVHGARAVVGLLVIETTVPLSVRETDLVRGILSILRNHLALLDYGELDTLTGLLNRKTLESHFDKLRQRMMAPHEPSWLALIDVDHFKSINDRYGHLFGDEVLLLVSQLMKRAFRGADQLFRFGGEEFVVILERASESGAQLVLERLRSAIGAHDFPQVGRVTVSVGYTQIDPRDVCTTCVERADSALYYAKSHGRNSVYCCEALIASGAIEARAKDQGTDIELF